MPKRIKNKNIQKNIDNMKNSNTNLDSKTDLSNTPDSSDYSDSSNKAFEEIAKQAISQKPTSDSKTDLRTKYPSRTLEELRNIDFLNQYENKLPEIKRPGYVCAWICNTPNKNYRDMAYAQGYDYILDVEPVASGYSDHTGEDKYAHYAMQIPEEIFKAKKKAEEDLRIKMYGHILNPNKYGMKLTRSESGMYDPEGRKIQTVNQVIAPDKE